MRNWLHFIALTLLLPAAPAAAQVLDSIDLERMPEAKIRVNFSVPVRYERHFPQTTGETLLVYVRPLQLGEADRLGIRERKSITGTPSSDVPLIDVTYEVNGTEGSRLVFKFVRPISYSVRQGRDNRSIEVTLTKPEKAAAEKKTLL